MSSEIFDIAARISVMDGATKILGAIGANVLGLGKHFEELEKKAHGASGRIKTALAGIGTAMVGVGMFEGLNKLEHAGEELVHVKTLFQAALPAAERVAGMAKITAAAFKESADNVRSTLVGNVQAMHDLYTVTQSVDHAIELLPSYNRLANAFGSVKDTEHLGDKASSGNIASAIRAFELTGRTTAEKLEKVSDAFVRATVALGEKAISGSQLMTQISNAGDARYGWSDDFLTKVLPAMIATGLQNRAGSALNAGSNNLYGGVSSSQFQGTFQEKWGIHNKSDELMDAQGKFKGFKVGSMWEGDKFRANPLEWANDYREMLHSRFGVDVGDAKKMQDIIGEIGRGNKLLKAELDELLLPQTNAQLNKEVGNIGKVGADALNVINANDPKAAREALARKWKDATDALGEQLVQPMIDNVIKPLTSVLKDVTKFAGEHPGELKELGKKLLVVSAGLTAIGTAVAVAALVAAISPAGWLVAGIGALGTALAAWGPSRDVLKKMGAELMTELKGLGNGNFKPIWDTFVTNLNAVGKWFVSIDTWISKNVQAPFEKKVNAWADSVIKEVESWAGRLAKAVAAFGTDLVTSIGDAIKDIPGKISGFLGKLFNKTSFEGGGFGAGGGFIKASYEMGDGGGPVGGGSADSIMNHAGGAGFNTRGVRNMNPGNIGYGQWAAAHGSTGAAGTDTGHGVAVFPSFEAGYAAMGSLALSKYRSGLRSIDALIATARIGWTPGNHAAAANVARMMGISPFADAHLDDPSMLAKFKAGLSVQELGPAGARFARDHMSAAARRPPQAAHHTIHTNVHLDGKVLARAVTKAQTRMAVMPHAISGQDDYGSWVSPGTTMMPA